MKWSFWNKTLVSSASVLSEAGADMRITGTAASCERLVSRTVSALDYEISRDGVSWVPGSVYLDVLFAQTFTEAMTFIAASLCSYGRAIVSFSEGRLVPIDPTTVQLEYDRYGRIYTITDVNANKPISSYVFIRARAPGWPIGRGAVDDVPEAIRAERAAYAGAEDILRNRTVFGTVVSVPSGAPQTVLDSIASTLTKAYSGRERGKVLAVGTDVKIDQLEAKLDGVLPTEMASNTKRVIASAYGVPYDMIDTEDSNKASVVDASSRYMRFTILPNAWLICDALSRSGYLPHFGIRAIRPSSTTTSTTQQQGVQQ